MAAWWERGGAYGETATAGALARLAVRLAPTARPEQGLIAKGPGSEERSDSKGDPGYRLADPRLAEYFRVVDEVSTKYKKNGDGTGSNDAVASCTQFAAHCIRATVDPDCYEMSTKPCRLYLEASPRWERACELERGEVDDVCEPGDVLCYLDDSHTALYVGHALVAEKFPAADAGVNVVEARYSDAAYPECVAYSADAGYPGHESTRIAAFRFTGAVGPGVHPYIDVWALLAGSE